jgi:hypothetical protein
MRENHGKMVLVRKNLKQFSISVPILVHNASQDTFVIPTARAWISEPGYGVCDSVPMEENSLPELPINVFTVRSALVLSDASV